MVDWFKLLGSNVTQPLAESVVELNEKFYGPIAPFYIHKLNTYKGTTPWNSEAEAVDPLRPFFGYWLSTGLDSSLTIWSPETKDMYLRPAQIWNPTKSLSYAGNFRFRGLATTKVRTVSTKPSNFWLVLKEKFDATAYAGNSYEHWFKEDWSVGGQLIGGATDIPYVGQWFTDNDGIEGAYNHPLPHYHEGYIDEHGNGFTTGVFIDEDWKEMASFLQSKEPEASLKLLGWRPPHHTHVISPLLLQDIGGTTEVGLVIHDSNHKGLDGFPFDPKNSFPENGTMNTDHDPKTGIELIEDVEEAMFLEVMNMFYSNEGLEVAIGTSTDVTQYFSSGTSTGQVDEGSTKYQLQKTKTKFRQHVTSDYKKVVQGHAKPTDLTGPLEQPWLNVDYQYYDNLFHLNLPELLGTAHTNVNFSKIQYESSVNKLGNQQHILIPSPYLFGQFAENPERFYAQGNPVANTPYGDLLSLAGETYKVHGTMFLDAQVQNLDVYTQLWAKAINNLATGEDGAINFPGYDSSKILGFPKNKFLQKHHPDPEWIYPWSAHIKINTPEYIGPSLDEFTLGYAPFIKNIFVGDWEDEDETPDGLMLYLMTHAANNWSDDTLHTAGTRLPPVEKTYWKRNVLSQEEITVVSWDLSWLVQNPDANLKYDVDTKNLISFDLGKLENYTNDPFGEDAKLSDWEISEALSSLRNKLKHVENLRSCYEIHNPPFGIDYKYAAATYDYNMSPFAHTEIVFYEIEKKKDGEIVQRFFIARPSKNAVPIEFFDSQIKLNEGYEYAIYAYVISIGNEYQYQDIQANDLPASVLPADAPAHEQTTTIDVESNGATPTPVAKVYVINKPRVELLKVPYAKFATLYARDYPPLFPNIEILPYQNVNDKLLFLFSQYVGEHYDYPIPITDGDEEIFNKVAKSQIEDPATDAKIKFKSDEPDYRYQVFRIEKPPTSWSDFSTALRKELTPNQKDFIENVVPNKKYYYMFRSTDRHNHISNPSPVFEVELIDDSGAIYLKNKIYARTQKDFALKVPEEETKSMRKYVHIFPTLKQSNLSTPEADSIYDAEGQSHDVALGSVFGTEEKPRKFKVRFTSKSSGKMFDLNLNLIHEHKTSEQGSDIPGQEKPEDSDPEVNVKPITIDEMVAEGIKQEIKKVITDQKQETMSQEDPIGSGGLGNNMKGSTLQDKLSGGLGKTTKGTSETQGGQKKLPPAWDDSKDPRTTTEEEKEAADASGETAARDFAAEAKKFVQDTKKKTMNKSGPTKKGKGWQKKDMF